MRRRRPEDVQRLGVFISKDAQGNIFFQRARQVNEVSVRGWIAGRERTGLSGNRSRSQARANGFGDVERSRALGRFFLGAVGKLDFDDVRHETNSLPQGWRIE